jgi:hypothetical protein
MKVLNISEKKEVAIQVFERYPRANKVGVTCDGEAFITDENSHSAETHAKNNRFGKELKVHEFTREELEGDEGDLDAARERLKVLDLDAEKINHNDLKKLVKDMLLVAPDNKKETLIAVLREAKEGLLNSEKTDE